MRVTIRGCMVLVAALAVGTWKARDFFKPTPGSECPYNLKGYMNERSDGDPFNMNDPASIALGAEAITHYLFHDKWPNAHQWEYGSTYGPIIARYSSVPAVAWRLKMERVPSTRGAILRRIERPGGLEFAKACLYDILVHEASHGPMATTGRFNFVWKKIKVSGVAYRNFENIQALWDKPVKEVASRSGIGYMEDVGFPVLGAILGQPKGMNQLFAKCSTDPDWKNTDGVRWEGPNEVTDAILEPSAGNLHWERHNVASANRGRVAFRIWHLVEAHAEAHPEMTVGQAVQELFGVTRGDLVRYPN